MNNRFIPLKRIFCVLGFAFFGIAFGQDFGNGILFTVNNVQVPSQEFVRVYEKNYDLVQDESQKDIDNYLNLYINYQLKLQEAKQMGLDTLSSYKREYNSYKKDLTQVYLSDNKVTDELVAEAYDRLLQDVKVTHILIRVDENSPDTINAINRLKELQPRLKSEKFQKLKTELHNGQTTYVEDLGYFSVFKMVYPFETVAYNTAVGEVSEPFKTRFGYHILKVEDKRTSRGEVTVAHIMVANDHKDSLYTPKERISQLYEKYKNGENFEALARQFSDDKASAANGGKLVPFKGGQLTSPEFEDKSFSLQNIGDVSPPFQTEFGWHIVKLLEKNPVEPLNKVRPELEVRIKRDSRSQLIDVALIRELKKQYRIKVKEDYIDYFSSLLNEEYFNRSWKIPDNLISEEELATIDNHTISYKEFAVFLENNQTNYFRKEIPFDEIVKKEGDEFLNIQLKEFHENNLENINDDFAHILKEYRDGLLLFDLMERKIWNEAMRDTVGLRQYYENHQAKYLTTKKLEGYIFSDSEKGKLEKIQASLSDENSLKTELAKVQNSEGNLLVTPGPFEIDHQLLPAGDDFERGVTGIYEKNGSYHFLYITKISESEPKSFESTKGRVISDYQDFLEAEWLKKLRNKYTVTINEKELKKIKKSLGK